MNIWIISIWGGLLRIIFLEHSHIPFGIQVFCVDIYFYFSWIYYPEVELLSYWITLCLTCEQLPNCFLKCYIPLQTYQQYMRVPVSASSRTLIIVCLSDYSHPNGYDLISHYGLFFCFVLFFLSRLHAQHRVQCGA